MAARRDRGVSVLNVLYFLVVTVTYVLVEFTGSFHCSSYH